MSETVIKLENISKQYRLGTVGSKTLRGDLQRWWYNIRGKDDPALKIGQENTLAKNQQLIANSDNYVWALRDINLEVKQGEILGIIGKNGAGKSTLLKLLSRVTGPTTGQIKIKGRMASLLEVGTGFHPELTGRENIFLNGAILGMTKNDIKLKFDEIVEFAGVAKYIDTPVKRYSSGMYVRLAFAVAAHLEPDILVVDEVLAVGDAEFQKKAIGKMQDVSRGGGRTVLFVSHNMASIEQLCSRGVLLENGKVSISGKISEVVKHYISKSNNSQLSKDTIREGSGKVSFEKIKICNGQNIETNLFHIGDNIKIFMKIKAREAITNGLISVNVKDNLLDLYTHITSDDDEFRIKQMNKGEVKRIELNLNSIKFPPGKYTLSFWIGEGRFDTADFLIDSNYIYIEQGTFVKRKKELPKGIKIFQESEWKIIG